MSRAERIIDGFEFTDHKEAVQAAKEAEGINYIRRKIDMENPYMVLQIYNKMVSQEMFETVAGYSFLKELQNFLAASPLIAEEDIAPIKVEHPPILAEEVPKEKQEQETEEKEKSVQKVTEKTRTAGKIDGIDYKHRCHVFSVISAVLAVCIIAMFVITATGKSTTIFNYENQLIDKYEAWEQELEQRETAVKERERQLGQD